jgi:non-heme chloroperoxidase
MLVQIVMGTPYWVWVLLAGLIVLGAVQLRDRIMSPVRLLALPLAMIVLSLASTASAFEMAPQALKAWVIGGTVAVLLLRPSAAAVPSERGAGLYNVAGSWWPLALILCIFCIRYAISVTLAINPAARHDVAFQVGSGLLSGAFAGIFLGRAFAILGIGRGRGLVRWAMGMVVLALLPLGAALAMIAWPPPAEETQLAKPSHELEAFLKTAPRFQPAEVQHYTARDGVERPYRQYDGAGKDALIFLHGSTGDSRYLALLSRRIAARTGLTVVTPDMRDHGFAPQRRGDDDYVGQQEHDIADLITALRARNFKRIFIGGHSLGGGAMIRYAAGSETPRADGLILLAPFINQASPAAFPSAGGWATPYVPRLIGIGILQRYKISAFDSLPVLRFRTPPGSRDGVETSLYSWRLWMSVTPRADWKKDIAHLSIPTLVIGAADDSIFRSEGYPEVFTMARKADVQIVPNQTHFNLVADENVVERIGTWLQQVPAVMM